MSLSSAPTDLIEAAKSVFGLRVSRLRPVTESFSSQVLRFVDTRGDQYVLKQPWSTSKALRELDALRRLEGHPYTPSLLGYEEYKGKHLFLMRGLDGEPMQAAEVTESLGYAIGEAMHILHAHPYADFDGATTWRTLLRRNAKLYRDAIGKGDQRKAERACTQLLDLLGEVPEALHAVMTHFDLRPGNLLVRDGCLIGLIDFEACRGGHPSMDFFKLWEELWQHHPRTRAWILSGYGDEAWMTEVERLMGIYSLYHGLAGLAWCYRREQLDSPFLVRNRRLLAHAEGIL